MHCPKCNRIHTSTIRATLHITCECGEQLELKYYADEPMSRQKDDLALRKHWEKLHLMRFYFIDIEMQFKKWLAEIPCDDCKVSFEDVLTAYPPVFVDAESFFIWTVLVHNVVNEKLGKPILGINEASKLWTEPQPMRRCKHMGDKLRDNEQCPCGSIFKCKIKGECTQSKPDKETVQLCGTCDVKDKMTILIGPVTQDILKTKPKVAVIVTYCEDDVQWAQEAVNSALAQEDVEVVVHTIADGIPPIFKSDDRIRAWGSEESVGPYVLTNSIPDFEADYIAILDGDDRMLPRRLIESVSTLEKYEADMIGGAMTHFTAEKKFADRVGKTTKPYNVYARSPYGAMVNSAKLFTTQLFEELNGFANWRMSADHEWDNRVALAGKRMYHALAVWGERRYHSNSLSNGKYPMHSKQRLDLAEKMDKTFRELKAGTITPQQCGGRDIRVHLERV